MRRGIPAGSWRRELVPVEIDGGPPTAAIFEQWHDAEISLAVQVRAICLDGDARARRGWSAFKVRDSTHVGTATKELREGGDMRAAFGVRAVALPVVCEDDIVHGPMVESISTKLIQPEPPKVNREA